MANIFTQIVIGVASLLIAWIGVKFVALWLSLRQQWKCATHFNSKNVHWFWGTLPEVWKVGVEGIFSLMDQRLAEEKRVVVVWRTSFKPVLVLCHPETVSQVLRTGEPKAMSFGGYSLVTPWIGHGLICSKGSRWERNRKLLTKGFHFNILKPYMKIYNEAAGKFMCNVENRGKSGDSVEVFSLAALCTLEVVLRCAFSYTGDIQEEGATHPYVKAVTHLAHLFTKRAIRPSMYLDLIYNLTQDGRDWNRLCKYVHDFADEIIDRRIQTLKVDDGSPPKRHLDFLDILLSARDEQGVGLDRREIRDEADTFMFAGHDTTASATSWSLYCLAKYPEWQDRLYDELTEVLGDREEVEWDDIVKMKQTTMFLREVLRMFPPVPIISRELENPIVIDGVHIPKKMLLFINLYALHRNDQVWKDAYEFNPERFKDETYVGRNPYVFVPFSAGPRNCIGQNFALNEEKVIIARFVRRFKSELDPSHKVVPVPEVVIRSQTGIRIKFTRR